MKIVVTNKLILHTPPRSLDVAREARNGGGICLVLTDRKVHCETIREILADLGVESKLLTGDLGNRERQRVVEGLNASQPAEFPN